MLVHNVFFWLKDDLDAGELAAFEQGLQALRAVETVRELYVGRPVGSSRAVVDASFSFALTVLFDDADALGVYQPHPVHRKFVEDFQHCWDRIVVYDAA